MTTKKRAKPEHLQKLTALFEQYPDGLNMRQIQTELQTSPHNAQAALDELGAVKAGAKWLLPDDDVVQVEQVAPGAKADIELSGNSGELPTTEKPQLVGDTDQLPKVLDQSMFDILPSKYRWATINIDGSAEAWVNAPDRLGDGLWDAYGECISLGGGFDGSKWRDIIQRESFIDQLGIENFQKECERTSTENPVDPCPMPCIDQPEDVLPEGEPQGELPKELPEGEPEGKCPVCKVATDVASLGLDGECQMCYEDATDKAWWDVVSDYSLIFENIMARVLSTIKAHGGATADRLRELTGMHPDDIEDAVQFMVDHKQLVGSPLYFTTVYEVAA